MDTQFFFHGKNKDGSCSYQLSAINFNEFADVNTVGPLANAGGAKS
jgi:hypothetical protein